jgi:nitroimidazol reductase NimA-like FMN-containing flavoprotein (pyridoxamine 5'-phosphate oxidase superfamily)
MLIHELNRQECLEVLKRTTLGRLACEQDGQPYIVPVSFNLDGGYIYSFATVGQKIRWMRANPLVCLEVEEITHRRQWTTVLAFGGYEELTNSAEHAAAQRRAHELFATRDRWWEPATAKTASNEPHAVVLYRIRVDRLTGRRASRPAAPLPPPSGGD